MKIDMAGISIELSRKRIKNLNLRINRQGEVKISAPFKFPLDLIHRYLHEKLAWINAHHARLQTQPSMPSLKFETGEPLFFLGKSYNLVVHPSVLQNSISMDEQNIHCYIKPDTTLIKREALLQQWYLQQMQELLPELIKKWERLIGIQINGYKIRDMKTRWGSCHPIKKTISLNLKLMQKPLACLEYVIVHELVHVLEASHNKRFYALMNQFMPDWKDHKKLLI